MRDEESVSPITRGQFLRGGGMVAAGALIARYGIPDSVAAQEGAAGPERASELIARSTGIPNYETPPDLLGSRLTPNELFFVRSSNAAELGERADGWSFRLGGLVETPVEIGLDELQRLPRHEVESVVQCSGNGRALSDPRITGSQWRIGAAGNAIWGGARIRDVIERLGGGLRPGVRYMTSIGGEPLPDEEIFSPHGRSVPIEKAMQDGIIAYEMNGEPLPAMHGKPFRLLHPGYYGTNCTKWLAQLRPTREMVDLGTQVSSYRLFPEGVSADDLDGPEDRRAPQCWAQEVKSILLSPVASSFAGRTEAGRVLLAGVAWSHDGPVERVDVSTDDGRSWRRAEFSGPASRFGWRTFFHEAELRPGRHTLLTRATDSRGRRQPARHTFNTKGYSNHSYRSHAVELEVVA